MNLHHDIAKLEGPFEQIAGVAATGGSNGSSDGPSLEIYFKDEKVTGKTKDIWVGQLVSLVAKTVPAGVNIENPVWTIADKIVGGYKVDPPTAGVLTPFDIKLLKSSSVWFYWANGGSKQVTFRGKINGVVNDVVATFNVQRPETSMVVSENAPPELIEDPTDKNRMLLRKKIEWDMHGGSQEGQLAWVQLGDVSASIIYDTVHYSFGSGVEYSGSGLDGGFFPTSPPPFLNDKPSIGADRKVALSMLIHDSFHDWIMFKHKDESSIWVPLKRVNWYWFGNASRVGTSGDVWKIDSSDYEKNPQAEDFDEFPTWDSIIPKPPKFTPIGQ